MKNYDDYDKWYSEWVKSWEENTSKEEQTKIYSFNPKENERVTKIYNFNSDSLNRTKVTLDLPISGSFLEKFETTLAKVDIALDNLLNYLHDKKNS